MNIARTLLITVAATLGIMTGPLLLPELAGASAANEILRGAEQASGERRATTNLNNTFKDIVNVILFVLGAIAVIMIIVGGIRYVTSGGDGTALTGAKNTILYAVVGLIVALLAYAIVNFVITEFAATPAPANPTGPPPPQNGPIQIE